MHRPYTGTLHWEFDDESGLSPLQQPAVLSFTISYMLTPGEPEYRGRYPDQASPGTSDEIEILKVQCTEAYNGDTSQPYPLQPPQLAAIGDWFHTFLEERAGSRERESVEESIYSDLTESVEPTMPAPPVTNVTGEEPPAGGDVTQTSGSDTSGQPQMECSLATARLLAETDFELFQELLAENGLYIVGRPSFNGADGSVMPRSSNPSDVAAIATAMNEDMDMDDPYLAGLVDIAAALGFAVEQA